MLVFPSLGCDSNEFKCVSKSSAHPPETLLSQDEIKNNFTPTGQGPPMQVCTHTQHYMLITGEAPCIPSLPPKHARAELTAVRKYRLNEWQRLNPAIPTRFRAPWGAPACWQPPGPTAVLWAGSLAEPSPQVPGMRVPFGPEDVAILSHLRRGPQALVVFSLLKC